MVRLLDKVLHVPLLFLLLQQAAATHIVGGEIERRYLGPVPGGALYEISLIQYFDVVNGNPNAEDAMVTVGIFEKGTNAFIRSVDLPRVSRNMVSYTNPACALASLSTRRIQYTMPTVFENSTFTSSNGYYIMWDRCCRNGSIANILLPGSTGQLFYMEFPPNVLNGVPFINSSPRLFPPISDYACLNQFFQFNIAGQDNDQDSLVYSAITPLAGFGSIMTPLPALQGAPYPSVSWNNTIGASAAAMIPGNPPFQISPQGMISFSPSFQGLFVFGVRCEEFRNGQKIGEVRRDFQILVISCPVNQAPSIRNIDMYSGQVLGDTLLLDTLLTCFSFWVSDVEANSVLTLSLQSISGLPLPIEDPIKTVNTTTKDSVNVSFCILDCNPLDTSLLVLATLRDIGCPFQKTDSVLLKIPIRSVQPQSPTLNASIPTDSPIPVNIREPFPFNVDVHHAESDLILLQAFFEDNSGGTTTLYVSPTIRVAPYQANVTWRPNCSVLANDSVVVLVVALSQECDQVGDTLRFVFIPQFPNLAPVLKRIEPLGEPTDSIFIVQQDLPFQLVYSVTDPDKDPVTGSIARLTMPLPAGMQLVTRRLGDSVLLDVRWTPSCSDLSSVPIILRMEAAESSCASLSSNQLVSIQSVDVVESTIPPNVITPNGDGQNDFFAISYLPDQCLFKGIKIFNRWGRVVFESTSDTFRWNGEPDPGGQYYYLAEYQQKTIKGFVHVMK